MKKSWKAIWSVVLSVCCLLSGMPVAAAATGTTYSGSNVESQNYSRWSSTIKSYLSVCEDGSLMRVQYVGQKVGVLVEYYDSSYNLNESRSRILPAELPIFGGFYETDANYFLVTGQRNPDESPDVEVFRITKYDKQWNRIGSAGLYDCNTTVPFDAGSLRMDDAGKYLLIRTSHEMYASKNDGLNHQANVTIQLDMETMRITDFFTSVSNSNYGYVSHSFNQFIQVENNRIVALDHGDAYPRSLVLSKYQADISTGSFASNGVQTVPVVTFPGAIGQNATGAAAGGLALSDSSYLVAGHSVIQDESNLTRSTRNVFVAAVDKETSAVTMNWLTSYAEGDGTTSTPQMVQISNSEFLILWSRDGQAYYTKVDGRGKRIAEIYSMEGSLSDCVPIIMNQKAIWYIWEDGTLIFYEIPLNALDQADSTVIENGHHCENHQYISSVTKQPTIYEPGIRTYTCSICGAQYTEEIPRLSAPEETPSGQTNAGKSSQGGAKRVKKNRKKTIGGVTYKVTKAGISKRAEVMVIGISGKRKKAVTIPATVRVDGVSCKVTGIGKRVFKGCGKLKRITIKTKTLRTVGKQAFKGIQKKAVIKVPKSKYKAYKKLFRANTGFRKTMKIKKLKS